MTYLDVNDLVEAVREELSGAPRRTQEEAAREVAMANRQAMETARDRVTDVSEEMGVTLLPHERDAAAESVAGDGVNPQDAVETVVIRSELDYTNSHGL